MIKNNCKECGKLLDNKIKLYCNNKCQKAYEYKKRIREYKNGAYDYSPSSYVPKWLRRYILQKFDNKCSKCGWSEVNPYTGKIPLEIEHIDGNSANNKEENLDLLCPNCHSLTTTYKGANKGNGRNHRMQRYYNEKNGIFPEKVIPKLNNCVDCGVDISINSTRCPNCDKLKQRKVANRPPLEQLLKDVEETNFVQTGKKYGVSDNCIRKWIKQYQK